MLHDGGRLRFTERPACSQLRHPGGRGHPGALLLQQPAGGLPGMQRLRRGARVRRVADRSRPGARAWARARSIPGPSRATRPAGALLLNAARSPRRRPGDARGQSSRERQRRELLHGKHGRYRRHLPLPQGARGEALQAVHPRLPAAVPAREAPAPPAPAGGSTTMRSPSAWPANRSRPSPRARSMELCTRGWKTLVLSRV